MKSRHSPSALAQRRLRDAHQLGPGHPTSAGATWGAARRPTAVRHIAGWLVVFLSCGCGGPDKSRAPQAEPGEELSAGNGTNRILLGPNAYSRPVEALSAERRRSFFAGNSFFNDSWVQAPSSTTARDGLGPTFNARSCSGCHFKDGRAQPPHPEAEDALGLLLRLSVPGSGPHGAPVPDATYGGQLQDAAIDGVPAEGRIVIERHTLKGSFDDGEPYELESPSYQIEDLAFGSLPADVRMSPRVAPAIDGLGYLEAIPEARLEELADPDDADGDGISGRVNHTWDPEREALVAGRFGWKAEQPTVLAQSAGAFLGDMGITSRLNPAQDCPEPQSACSEATSGGTPEIEDDRLNKVALYASSLAVPIRQNWSDPLVLEGKRLFFEAGCQGCHVPEHVTGEATVPELSGETIRPFTDLLLHDLGEELGDGRPSFEADGREWRTPPLWGLGWLEEVNGHLRLLHDGRARGFAEAVLWHGGEAEVSKTAFVAMSADERDALVAFLGSL